MRVPRVTGHSVKPEKAVLLDPRQRSGVVQWRATLIDRNKYHPRTANRPKERAKDARRAAGI